MLLKCTLGTLGVAYTISWVKVKISIILNFWKSNLKTCSMPIIINNFKLKWSMSLDKLKLNQRSHKNLFNSGFWGWLSMESQPQNPEFRINPKNFYPCYMNFWIPAIPVNPVAYIYYYYRFMMQMKNCGPWSVDLNVHIFRRGYNCF